MDDIGSKARSYGAQAIDVLAEVMNDDDGKPSDRRAAAEALLDRGYGKPVAAVISVPANGEAVRRLAAYSDAALLAAVAAGRLLEASDPTPVHPQIAVPTAVAVRDSHTTIENEGGQPANPNASTKRYLASPTSENRMQVPNGILPSRTRRVGALLEAIATEAPDSVDPLAL